MPERKAIISEYRCVELPTPALEKVSTSGSALAFFTRSAHDLMPLLRLATSTKPALATGATKVKSFNGS